MPLRLAKIFAEFNSILLICPCCGEVCRLGDARPYLKGRKPSTPFDRLEGGFGRIERAEDRLEQEQDALRADARARGRLKAKNRLRKIDPVFSGSGVDPQDVKVIFDPVEYVVFDGLANYRLRRILLMGERPSNQKQEKIQNSIGRAIRKGNTEFVTLRVTEEGTVEKG